LSFSSSAAGVTGVAAFPVGACGNIIALLARNNTVNQITLFTTELQTYGRMADRRSLYADGLALSKFFVLVIYQPRENSGSDV
jgi:hypothetical protein